MASISFEDVDEAIKEIQRVKEAGLKGVTLPAFHEKLPLYADVSTRSGARSPTSGSFSIRMWPFSSTSNGWLAPQAAAPHPACVAPLFRSEVVFHVQQIVTTSSGEASWNDTRTSLLSSQSRDRRGWPAR
jgi:hypothetical protein